MPPSVHLTPAAKADQPALENLMQHYCYDWSELRGFDVGDDGRFEAFPLESYWLDPLASSLAGLALILQGSRRP